MLNSELMAATAAMIERVGVDTTTPPAPAIDTSVWTALTEAGFTGVGIPEERDGSGGTLADALAIVSAAVGHGARTMLIEHTVLAGWLAAQCGISLGPRTATVALADRGCTLRDTDDGPVLDGPVTGVVHGSAADVLVVLVAAPAGTGAASVVLISPSARGAAMQPGTDLVGAAVGDYLFTASPIEGHSDSPIRAEELEERGALAYSVALAAAARSVCDATVSYAGQRSQFGRPLSTFQAIQQRSAGLSALTTLVETAAEAAVAERAAGGDPLRARLATAAAKTVAAWSSREIAAAGHQIHGAIGFTAEHNLGRYTTALWAWRNRYGSEQRWAGVLAEQILENGTDVWDLVVGLDSIGSTASGEGNHR